MQQILAREARRTRPDYFAYIPSSWDDQAEDRTNEHFLVFEGPGDALMAIWTQSWQAPGLGNINRTMFARSEDAGVTWSPPRRMAGPQGRDDPAHMASWAFPMVSQIRPHLRRLQPAPGHPGWIKMHTGTMDGVYSDDGGRTWSPAAEHPHAQEPLRRSRGQDPGRVDRLAEADARPERRLFRRLLALGQPGRRHAQEGRVAGRRSSRWSSSCASRTWMTTPR